jgi:hypothetical protein
MTYDVGLPQTSQREMEEHSMCFVVGKINSLQGQMWELFFLCTNFQIQVMWNFLSYVRKSNFFELWQRFWNSAQISYKKTN